MRENEWNIPSADNPVRNYEYSTKQPFTIQTLVQVSGNFPWTSAPNRLFAFGTLSKLSPAKCYQ
jgi:hypothetical protein